MMLREPWRTRLLFVSFAINLLLIPIAGARYLPFRLPLTHDLPRTEMIITHMTRNLPAADADRFRASMEGHMPDIEAARARMLAARTAMSSAIGRSPFDQAAVQTSMLTWRAAWNKWSEALSAAMLDALPGLSDEGRRKLSEAGRRPPS